MKGKSQYAIMHKEYIVILNLKNQDICLQVPIKRAGRPKIVPI